MSYNTYLSGAINIKPDFTTVGSVPTFSTVKLEHRVLPPVGVEGSSLFVPPTIVIGAISAGAPEWVTEEMVLNDLTAIIAALPEGTEFDGYLEGNGEEASDVWRVYVVDGQPVVVKPKIVWEVPGVAAA